MQLPPVMPARIGPLLAGLPAARLYAVTWRRLGFAQYWETRVAALGPEQAKLRLVGATATDLEILKVEEIAQ